MDNCVEMARKVDFARPWNSPYDVSLLDRISVDDWLLKKGFSDSLRKIFSDVAPGSQSMLGLLSLVAGAGGSSFFFDTEAFTIGDGAGSLIGAISNSLEDVINFEMPVERIEIAKRSVVVEAKRSNGQRCQYRTRAVVVAIPPSCWPYISGLPGFLLNLAPEMSKNRKLSLIVKLAKRDHLPGGCEILTDGPCRLIRQSHFPNFRRERVAKVDILVCPFLGRGNLTKRALASTAMKSCNIHNRRLRAVHEHRWDRVIWSRGAYPVFGPNRLSRNYHWIIDGQPPMFFAGDCVIPGYAGYMEGALRSSEIAVHQVTQFLKASHRLDRLTGLA